MAVRISRAGPHDHYDTWRKKPHSQVAGSYRKLMNDQFNCVKEMSLAETAESFHSAGYNVLLYDSRSIGGSGGLPRNQIDPLQMAQDISGEFFCVCCLSLIA